MNCNEMWYHLAGCIKNVNMNLLVESKGKMRYAHKKTWWWNIEV